MTDERPFRSVSHALRIGYGAEARNLYKLGSAFAHYRPPAGEVYEGVGAPMPEYLRGLTAHDRAAEAGKVVGVSRRVLSGPELLAVEAYYLPNDKSEPGVVFRKQYCCAQLIPIARRSINSSPSDEFMAAAVAAWAELEPMNGEEWAKRLKVSRSTISLWRNKGSGTGGINGALGDLVDRARARLGGPMRSAGLIP